MGRKKIPTSPASPFYGFPAEIIAEWCGVSVGTAAHYKSGRRKPPTPVLRLFRLMRDQKVLGKEWDGYEIHRNKLFGPDGRYVTPSHVSHMALVWHALAESNPSEYERLLMLAESRG